MPVFKYENLKSAASGKAIAAAAGAGIGGAGLLDYLQHPDSKYPFDPAGGTDRWRFGNAGINAALLGAIPHLLGKGNIAGATAAFGAPFAKDLMVAGMPAVKSVTRTSDDTRRNMLLGLGLGGGALGLGAMGLAKYMTSKDKQNGGRVRITLPTKDPNDRETVVEMPLEEVDVSSAQRSRLGRDVRKRLRSETRERTMKRDPETGKMIPFAEWSKKYSVKKEATARLISMVEVANRLWT